MSLAVHAFISYSHSDQKHFERLTKHMAMLTRDGTITAWSDHVILPGSKIGQEIDKSLEISQLFIALVSPDYLSSNYCYEKEFLQALRMVGEERLRLVPIILEPCDWLSSPLSEFLALPKDGKPIAEWTNENVAFLDVVKGIRRIVGDVPSSKPATTSRKVGSATVSDLSSRIKVKQEFDSIQRRDFADQAFLAVKEFFRASCSEIDGIEDLKARFQEMSDGAFTCTVVNRGLTRGRGEAHITIRLDRSHRGLSEISYIFEAHAGPGTSQGNIRVESDDYNLFLTLDSFFRGGAQKLDSRQVAERLWTDFVKQAGVEIEDG